MITMEWGATELLALLASVISIEATGAQVIALNIYFVCTTIPFGGQTGTLVCIGKAMGQARPKAARIYLKMSVVVMLVFNTVAALILVNFKLQIAALFTSNQAILAYLDSTIATIALVLLSMGIHTVESAALRAMSLQKEAVIIVAFCQYLICLPFGYLFGIKLVLGVQGLWLGVLLGSVCQVLLYFYVLAFRINWDHQSTRISAKMKRPLDLSTQLSAFDQETQLGKYPVMVPIPRRKNTYEQDSEDEAPMKFKKAPVVF